VSAWRPGIIALVITELVPPDTGRAFEAMRELRPALASRESFVQQVDERQRPVGYRLLGSVAGDEGPVLAVAGFRVGENLAWGRYLYVDDLSTLPTARKQGHARQLLEWPNAEAARLGIQQVHLDSGVGADRASAHRLYFTNGYRIISYHFARQG
jgi:GNAT superfamily N-acetyltransferase